MLPDQALSRQAGKTTASFTAVGTLGKKELLDMVPGEKTIEGEGQKDEDVAVVDEHENCGKCRLKTKTPRAARSLPRAAK